MDPDNYKFTLGELLDALHERLALGTDPDTPVYVRQAGTDLPIQTIGDGGKTLVMYVQPQPTVAMKPESVTQAKSSEVRHPWRDVDWSKPTGRIAHELGVAATQVSRARRKYARRTLKRTRG